MKPIVPDYFSLSLIDTDTEVVHLTVIYEKPSVDVVVYSDASGKNEAVYAAIYKNADVGSAKDLIYVVMNMVVAAYEMTVDRFMNSPYEVYVSFGKNKDSKEGNVIVRPREGKERGLVVPDLIEMALDGVVNDWIYEYIDKSIKSVKTVNDYVKLSKDVYIYSGSRIGIDPCWKDAIKSLAVRCDLNAKIIKVYDSDEDEDGFVATMPDPVFEFVGKDKMKITKVGGHYDIELKHGRNKLLLDGSMIELN